MTAADAPPPYGTVVFDCDSTLSAMEGIEELARDWSAELERLTRDAMDGRVPLEAVYGRRLELVSPSEADVERIGRLYVERLVPNADRLVDALHALDKRVHVVSGGLLPAVLRLAQELEIEPDAVDAVDLYWNEQGGYAGYDEDSPLARAGGKVEVLARIAALPDAGPVALVGDGATDLEAAREVARFVAYGGVERRAPVFAAAAVTCDAPDFRALVPLLLAPHEIESLRAGGEHDELLSELAPSRP